MESNGKYSVLYGDLNRDGVSLSSTAGTSGLSSALADDCIHLLLNRSGQVVLMGEKVRMCLTHSMLGICHKAGGEGFQASGLGEGQECLVLSVTRRWVERSFGSRSSALHPELMRLLEGSEAAEIVQIGKARAMNLAEKEIVNQLVNPPVHERARLFWYSAKVLELLSLYLFVPASEGLCSERKRAVVGRIELVLQWLDEHLDEALNLKALAKSVGCAPHYLSRQFSAEVGMTISQKLRQLRIDRAASFLRGGDYNVTEAAVEVGYSSLSHFTKAFVTEMGIKPSEYLEQAV